MLYSSFFALWISLLFGQSALAETACFNFKKDSHVLLKPAPSQFLAGQDPAHFDTNEKDDDWGQISGIVKRPIEELYQMLQNPKTIRNGKNTTVEVTRTEPPGYLKLIQQKIVIKPIFFMTIAWTEDWAFTLEGGTKEKPSSILISYQKSEGTSHIKKLCGNILLKSLSPSSTGVYLYEEVQADRRSAEDVLNGITGTLHTLRAGHAPAPGNEPGEPSATPAATASASAPALSPTTASVIADKAPATSSPSPQASGSPTHE